MGFTNSPPSVVVSGAVAVEGGVGVFNDPSTPSLGTGPIETLIASGTIPAGDLITIGFIPSWVNTITVLVAPAAGNANVGLVKVVGNATGFGYSSAISATAGGGSGSGTWALGGATNPIPVYRLLDSSWVVQFLNATVGTQYFIYGSNEYYNQTVTGEVGITGGTVSLSSLPIDTAPRGGTFSATNSIANGSNVALIGSGRVWVAGAQGPVGGTIGGPVNLIKDGSFIAQLTPTNPSLFLGGLMCQSSFGMLNESGATITGAVAYDFA
jgi:hypothetical protein